MWCSMVNEFRNLLLNWKFTSFAHTNAFHYYGTWKTSLETTHIFAEEFCIWNENLLVGLVCSVRSLIQNEMVEHSYVPNNNITINGKCISAGGWTVNVSIAHWPYFTCAKIKSQFEWMSSSLTEVTCICIYANTFVAFCTAKNRINKNKRAKSTSDAPLHSMRATVKSMM